MTANNENCRRMFNNVQTPIDSSRERGPILQLIIFFIFESTCYFTNKLFASKLKRLYVFSKRAFNISQLITLHDRINVFS